MTEQETQLVAAINAKEGFQAFPAPHGCAVLIVQQIPNGVRQFSVWLGRKSTADRLQQIAAS